MTVAAHARPGARRLEDVTMEGAFTVAHAVRTRRAAGYEVHDLSIGEPGFPTPAHVIAAAVESLGRGETRYAPPAGIDALREAIAASHETTTGARCAAGQVVVTPGAKAALFHGLLAVLGRGDEVLVPDPGFPAYRSIASIAGARPIAYPMNDAVDAIATRITSRTCAIVINSPNNPTGAALGSAGLEAIASLARAHDLWIVSDEVYARLWYGEGTRAPSVASVGGIEDRLIVIDGFSKSHSMTGWRLGHCIAPPWLAEAITRIAVNVHSCVAPFVQQAGVAALTGPDPVPAFVRSLRARRDQLVDGLQAIPGVTCTPPDGAFFAFARFDHVDDVAFTRALLDRHGVAAVAGSAFSPTLPNRVRFSFATSPEVLSGALAAIAACAAEFRSSR